MATAAPSAPTTPGRATTPTLVACLAGFVAVVMAIAGLGGAYSYTRYALRRANPGEPFFPAAMPFNNYAAFVVFLTFILASMSVGWAITCLRVGNRRWAGGGFGFAIFANLAAANIIWFIGNQWEGAANALPWWLHSYALLTLAGIATAVAVVASVLSLARIVTAQSTGEQPQSVIGATWLQHGALAVWTVVYLLIFLYK